MSREELSDLFHTFVNSKSDACSLSAEDAEKTEIEWREFVQRVPVDEEISRLKDWKESEMAIWMPVINYCQDHKNAERLGFKLGVSISERIIEILKLYNIKNPD